MAYKISRDADKLTRTPILIKNNCYKLIEQNILKYFTVYINSSTIKKTIIFRND